MREKTAQEAVRTIEDPEFDVAASLVLEKAHPRQNLIVADLTAAAIQFISHMFRNGIVTAAASTREAVE
jgi:hypothetical protein